MIKLQNKGEHQRLEDDELKEEEVEADNEIEMGQITTS
eukprot:CAMPEP_0201585956 /NCGR_PEP_ID=MMETSP0190_2-20130828/127358_1 /ASSEMBLY_ACC=CAM_ASM_000263 /TAXON_ID=37353 /ORGANISM="Rosalina sp." /LENGTH=37 /DNA_ID= /DNA_START= /DNA_END= /DNA_ORIENTATION=